MPTSSFKNSVSLLGILTNPHIYSHKSGKNVAMIKNKKLIKARKICFQIQFASFFCGYVGTNGTLLTYVVYLWLYLAIFAVAMLYHCSKTVIEFLFHYQILRFFHSKFLLIVAMYQNQHIVAKIPKCCQNVAMKMANFEMERIHHDVAILMWRWLSGFLNHVYM